MSPTRPVNDRPTRTFPAPPRRRQASAGTVFDAPTSDTSTNPFLHTNHVHDHPQPPIHPDLRTGTVSSPTIVPAKPQPLSTLPAPAHHASNPFVNRPGTVVTRSSPSPERRLPPLPPRKVPPVLPPRSFPSPVSTSSSPSPPKPSPPQLPTKVRHLTSALMQQSLQASKAGQEAKRIQAQREQERVLQVLKSSARSASPPKRLGVSSGGSSRSSVDGAGATIPVLPPRRHVSPPTSVTSTRSFEQVAGASLASRGTLRRSPSPLRPRSGSRSPSRSSSPSRPTTDLPPPVHPNRKTSTEYTTVSALPAVASTSFSTTTTSTSTTSTPSSPPRFGRSKSVNQTSPPPVPRRRRPDSVQLLPSPGEASSSSPSHLPHMASTTPTSAPSPSRGRLSRHLSLTPRESRWDDMRDTFSAVRYKAEAGISRRGWVPGLEREERLITERRESGVGSGVGGGVPSTSSSEDGLGVDAESPAGRARRRTSLERDEMKWPAGDGWRPLS